MVLALALALPLTLGLALVLALALALALDLALALARVPWLETGRKTKQYAKKKSNINQELVILPLQLSIKGTMKFLSTLMAAATATATAIVSDVSATASAQIFACDSAASLSKIDPLTGKITEESPKLPEELQGQLVPQE